MEFLVSFLNTLLPILYFIAAYLYGMFLFRDDRFAERYMQKFLRFTVLLHLIEVVLRGIYYKHYPLASVFEAMATLALALVLIYLYLEQRLKVKTTGYFVLILVFFLQLFSSAFVSFTREIPAILHNPLFGFHTTAAILAYASLAISSLYGIMYLLLFYDIKRSRFGVIYNRLPSLEVLSELSQKAAGIGVFFLTIAIIIGFVWAEMIFNKFHVLDPKIVVVYLTWLIYLLQLVGGRILKWGGRRLAFLSVGGFAVIIFSMLAVNFLMTSFHVFQ